MTAVDRRVMLTNHYILEDMLALGM